MDERGSEEPDASFRNPCRGRTARVLLAQTQAARAGPLQHRHSHQRERDLSPTTEAEWKRVEDGAATVVLATNSLMVPGYQRAPIADWNRHAKGVADVALRAKAAVEKKDMVAMMEIGDELDRACEACHKQFSPAIAKPYVAPAGPTK